MIDIDKYDKVKITEGPWKYIREEDRKSEFGDSYRIFIVAPPYGTDNRLNGQGRIAMMLGEHTYYDAQLIADAPLLLEEVKRLREQGRKLVEAAERVRSEISDQDTGWYYQLGNHIEKMNRLVKE